MMDTFRFRVEMPSVGTPEADVDILKSAIAEVFELDPRKVSVTFEAVIE